jgi:hypothetical protein
VFDGTEFVGDPWHAVDHAGFLVLSERAGTCMAHFQGDRLRRRGPSRENHTDGISAGKFRDGIEQHIDRRAMTVDRFALERRQQGAWALTTCRWRSPPGAR